MAPSERLIVEIDHESEPISGLVRRLDGPRRPGEAPVRRFRGYMELIAALEGFAGLDAQPGERGGR